MNDKIKEAIELWRETAKQSCSCLDCKAVRTILAYIDNFPAQLENLREACALEAIEALIETGEDPRAADSLGDRLRGVPLNATPLNDETNQLLRDQLIIEATERDRLRTWVTAVSEALGAIEPVSDCRVEMGVEAAVKVAESLRARVARAESDSVLMSRVLGEVNARVAELEAQNAKIATEARNLAYALEAADERQAEADKKLLDVHDSLHRECNGPVDLGREIRDLRSALEQQVSDLRKMYDAAERRAEKAEAQVAAARAECARIHSVHPMEDAYTAATGILRAMDEAKNE